VPRLTLLFFGAAKVFQKQQKWSPPGQLTYIEAGKPMAKRGPLARDLLGAGGEQEDFGARTRTVREMPVRSGSTSPTRSCKKGSARLAAPVSHSSG
jgi:hypothetical protein